jgi:hypothetical protein
MRFHLCCDDTNPSVGQSFVYLGVSVLNMCWGSRLHLSTHIKQLTSEMRMFESVVGVLRRLF